MTANEIKRALRRGDITQAELARSWGVAPVTVHYLIARKLKSARLEKRLADVLGVSVETLRAGRA